MNQYMLKEESNIERSTGEHTQYYINGKKANENESNTKRYVVQIPDEVIRNVWYKLDAYAFSVYALLKHTHFRNPNANKEELEVDHNKLKHKLYISDNRTLKKTFAELHKGQFIKEYITNFPRRGGINLTFDPLPSDSKAFTQLPITIFNKIEHIGVIGLRLLFFYESFINRSDDPTKHFAFPSIETTSLQLGINKETIVKYNEILKKNKLLKIKKHKLEENGYNSDDTVSFTKYNNHYYVKLNNL